VSASNSTAGIGALPQQRAAVQQKIQDALRGIASSTSEEPALDPSGLATCIEDALEKSFIGDRKGYMHKARSILFNLKDRSNADFGSMLLAGWITPAQVPQLTADQMASYEKGVQRAQMRKECLEEVQADWDLRHRAPDTNGLLTCEKCSGTQTTYIQLQTRKGDEPMTTFALCRDCGSRWKC